MDPETSEGGDVGERLRHHQSIEQFVEEILVFDLCLDTEDVPGLVLF